MCIVIEELIRWDASSLIGQTLADDLQQPCRNFFSQARDHDLQGDGQTVRV